MSIILDSIQFTQGDFNLSLDLKINDNEFHSIIGPSGSGKTTLLRLLAGFLKPDSGKIIINGKDFSNIQTSKRNIGMVFQDYALFPNMNVFNNIAYGL
ncbi:MAG: ATP-binding cassette domain-containing protein, partial [Spirochaetales bacterium]|nr:ATP-binding cassette domain-containing protein [Spirochaetales bacterium]